jgi:acid phosphatase type 7
VITVKRTIARTLCLLVWLWATQAFAQDGIRKGPWLMDLQPTSIVVMVERDAPGPVHVTARPLGVAGPIADSAVVPDASPNGVVIEAEGVATEALQEVTLRGLTAGTRYTYEVSGAGMETVSGAFSTPPLRAAPFRFAIYGDTRSDHAAHAAVARALMADGPDFAIHTGDLVADGRDEDDWQRFFQVGGAMLRNVPFVPVIGNHEFVSPAASGAANYRRYVHFDASGPSPELDTVFRFANARFILTSSYDDWTGPSRDWLTSEIERARREDPTGWLFVVMHEGPRSSGPHGDSDALRDAGIDRLMRRMRVDLVISGHDHAYERGDDEGIRYMVSGGGGAPLYPRRSVRSHTKVFASTHHFVRVDIDGDRATFTALRVDGSTIDHAVLRHDGWEDMRPQGVATPDGGVEPVTSAPVAPIIDWESLIKVAPLLVGVSVLAWWARRRQS